MRLYLVRHAEAIMVGGAITRDRDRSLTPEGGQDAGLLGRFLAMNDPSIGLILTSPLVRAIETGEMIRSQLSPLPPARTSENLSPGFRRKALLKEVATSRAEAVVAVGHQPDMSELLMWLVADSRGVIEMPTCAAALVKLGPGTPSDGAALRWLVTPALLRQQYPNKTGSYS